MHDFFPFIPFPGVSFAVCVHVSVYLYLDVNFVFSSIPSSFSQTFLSFPASLTYPYLPLFVPYNALSSFPMSFPPFLRLYHPSFTLFFPPSPYPSPASLLSLVLNIRALPDMYLRKPLRAICSNHRPFESRVNKDDPKEGGEVV